MEIKMTPTEILELAIKITNNSAYTVNYHWDDGVQTLQWGLKGTKMTGYYSTFLNGETVPESILMELTELMSVKDGDIKAQKRAELEKEIEQLNKKLEEL